MTSILKKSFNIYFLPYFFFFEMEWCFIYIFLGNWIFMINSDTVVLFFSIFFFRSFALFVIRSDFQLINSFPHSIMCNWTIQAQILDVFQRTLMLENIFISMLAYMSYHKRGLDWKPCIIIDRGLWCPKRWMKLCLNLEGSKKIYSSISTVRQ